MVSDNRNESVPQGERQCWTHISREQPDFDRDWDVQCARCGSSLEFEICDACGGDGVVEEEDYEMCDTFYERCPMCDGKVGLACCLSSDEYCDDNPIEGREHIESGTPEWFTFDPPESRKP